ASLVSGWDGVEETHMFGCPSFRVDGELFAVVSSQGLALTRLSEADRRSLRDRYLVRSFDANGRRVDSWAVVNIGSSDLTDVEQWLRASYENARKG
ncbi:MAG: TfoX/Sxy family protein, partial [Halobacteriales archaeon]|nr:TfoX/Sxy family protein [Halobacteriales archaeon]